ncbi:MAG TPA: DNA-directed RNA polymerase subunit omega [Bacilli bacterium]|nr:DNA-directed RNA polymerase subunit omega [Bacilli bacterium]
MIYPSIDKLLNLVDSKYILVYVASKRSKEMLQEKHFQLKDSEYKNKRELGRALEELERGLIKIV